MYTGIKLSASETAYTDISSQVLTDSIDITEKLHNGLKPVCNSIRFRLKAGAGLYRALFEHETVYCLIKNGDDVLLRGTLRPIFSGNAIRRTAPINVEAVDFQYVLKNAVQSEILLMNKPIFDAEDLPNCILYQLFAPLREHGVSFFSGDFIGAVPVFYAGTDKTYEAVLNTLCYEYGFVYIVDDDTVYVKKLIYDDLPESTFVFDQSNMAAMPSVEKKEYAKEQVSVEWNGVAVYEDDPVWEDTSGATGYWPCWIEVLPDGVYPAGADEKTVWANFGSAKGELLHISNVHFDIDMDPGLSISSSSFEAKRAAFKITNSLGRIQVIKRMRITGTSTVQTDKNYSKYPATTSETVENYTAQYIQSEQDAENLCRHLYTWAKNSRYVITLTSSINRPLGETVTYVEKDSGISFTCRIIEKRYAADCRSYRYVLEAVAKVVVGDVSTDLSIGRPGATPESKPGISTRFMYAVSGSESTYPDFAASEDSPGEQWVSDMPAVSSLQYLWLTAAQWQGTVRISDWSLPVRLTGSQGAAGMPVQLPDDSRCVLYFSCDDVIGTKIVNNAKKNSTGALTGGKQVPGIGGTALRFESGQFVEYKALPPLESLTLSVFFRLDRYGTVTQQSAKSLYINAAAEGLTLYPTPTAVRTLTAPIALNIWYCIVYAYDHTARLERIKLYAYTVNSAGSAVLSGTDAWQFSCTRDFSQDYGLTNDEDPDLAAGILDELRVDSYAWSDDECSGWAVMKGGQYRKYTAADYSVLNIGQAVAESQPRYLGALNEDPAYARIGDWYAYAGETTGGREKGHCYRKVSASLWVEDTDMAHNMAAMQDLLDISKDATDSTLPAAEFVSALTASDAFIDRLVTNRAFIDKLAAKTIILHENGSISSSNYKSGHNGEGFTLNADGFFECTNGIFRGSIDSGPLKLSLNPPSSEYESFSAGTPIRNIIHWFDSKDLHSGKYNCNGFYGRYNFTNLDIEHFWYSSWSDTVTERKYKEPYREDWGKIVGHYYTFTTYNIEYEKGVLIIKINDEISISEDYEICSYTSNSTTGVIRGNKQEDINVNVSNYDTSGKLLDYDFRINFAAGAYSFIIENLPTSFDEGLSPGTVYRSGNYLMIKT